jgi:hypothetical protein
MAKFISKSAREAHPDKHRLIGTAQFSSGLTRFRRQQKVHEGFWPDLRNRRNGYTEPHRHRLAGRKNHDESGM